MITETPPVKRALDELRHELDTDRVDFSELVVLGARTKTAELRRQRPSVATARSWLAERIRHGDLGVDPAAADEAKRAGLIET
jgi:hypothetical protein